MVAVAVAVVDDAGAVVPGAVFVPTQGVPVPLGDPIGLTEPVAGLVVADGHLDEPVILDPAEPEVRVALWRTRSSAGEQRRALQFGGDVMLGRRYQEPTVGARTAMALDGVQSRAVVAGVAPIMAAADASFVNLETVFGDLPEQGALAGKRFLLQSPTFATDALQDMGIDLVALGNNHAYDWGDQGVADTLSTLDAAGIAHAGSGLDEASARAGTILDVAGLQVATLSYTTVNGDFVNDSLPGADAPIPDELGSEWWQYELRSFGFGSAADPAHVPTRDRRIGEMWAVFEQIEEAAPPERVAALWAAVTADGAYPELQDWVARRGHGGAAAFSRATIAEEVARQRAAGADLVVVQIHGGFQFSEVASDALRANSEAAIDAGADLVVAHHPHVLQGFEWYRGRLIAHSLGNFVFDQDFLATFPSVILRTVFEGDRLVEARVVPLTIDRYRPVPVSGRARAEVLRMLDVRSAMPATAARISPLVVGGVIDPSLARTASVRLDGTTGLIGTDRSVETIDVTIGPVGVGELPDCTLVRAEAGGPELGVDVFGWGAIDDSTANGVFDAGTHWVLGPDVTSVRSGGGAMLRFEPDGDSSRRARPVARSATPQHRWFDAEGVAVDGPPTYSVALDVRREGTTAPLFGVRRYRVEDADPTADPTSDELSEGQLELPLRSIGSWESLHLDISGLVNADDVDRWANAVLMWLEVPPGGGDVEIDDVRLYEWRAPSAAMIGLWHAADAVRGAPGEVVTLTVSRCTAPPAG